MEEDVVVGSSYKVKSLSRKVSKEVEDAKENAEDNRVDRMLKSGSILYLSGDIYSGSSMLGDVAIIAEHVEGCM